MGLTAIAGGGWMNRLYLIKLIAADTVTFGGLLWLIVFCCQRHSLLAEPSVATGPTVEIITQFTPAYDAPLRNRFAWKSRKAVIC